MLKDCLEVFEYQLAQKGPAIVEDNHIPADGLYLLVDLEHPEEPKSVEIIYDKKLEKFPCEGNSIFSKVRRMDYYSKLLEMNKPIDDKKVIHTNNYLAFSLKQENLKDAGKLDQERIEVYYGNLRNPYERYVSKNKAKAAELYKVAEEQLGKPEKEKLNQCRNWIENYIFQLDKLGIELTGKGYLKIFFDVPMEEYQREWKRYLIPNIYNSNDFNQTIHGVVMGLPNNNMGMNAKKPFLEHKTRPAIVPLLEDSREVLLQNQFFDYLYGVVSAGKNNVYVDLDEKKILAARQMPDQDCQGIFLRIEKGKNEAEIMMSEANACFRKQLPRNLDYKNYLELDFLNIKNEIPDYGNQIRSRKKVQDIIDDVYFSKFLTNNYFRDAGDIKIKRAGLKQSLLLARNSLFRWLYLGEEQNVKKVLEQISMIVIKGTIEEGFLIKATHQFNLRCSLQVYFKKEGEMVMGDRIKEIKESLREKINSKETACLESDEEYYFAVGQLVRYFLSLNKSNKKTHALGNPFFNAKSDKIMKEKLRACFMKYDYAIEQSRVRFNNLYGMVVAYQPEVKVNQDLIIAGYLHNNLIYEKREEEKE